MNIAVSFHQPVASASEWSTPLGLAQALEACGVQVYRYPFADPQTLCLPPLEEMLASSIDALLVCSAGPAPELDRQLLALRHQIEQRQLGLKVICELGDEPQTRWCNALRVQASHLSLSPDAASAQHWRSLGAHCLWFTHWADTTVFREDHQVDRCQFVVTTMGRRRYARRLKMLLGRRFVNRQCIGTANGQLYSSGQVAFQYARWGEITRRVFEAAACGCCVLTNRLSPHTRLEELLPADQAVLYYDGFWSLCSALWRLQSDPVLRQTIAREGQRRVLRFHTQHMRARALIQACKLLLKHQDRN